MTISSVFMTYRLPLGLVLIFHLALTACGGGPPIPKLAVDVEPRNLTPVVLVPGVTGTALRNNETGKLVWGTGWRLFFPRDGGTGTALPITPEGRAADAVEPAFVLEEIRLGPIRSPVYGPVLETLEAHGFRRGDLDDPQPGETLFTFAYDWRRDNVESAAELLEKLRRLARVRGESPLEVGLICQSNGSHLCRWLAKYGDATLEEAEAGAGPPGDVHVQTLVLVGTANGGALRIFREMHRGRTYVPLLDLGRDWRPEVLFTLPSLYQDLAGYRDQWFVGSAGQLLDVDLYDARSWVQHGWSVFSEKARRRLRKKPRPGLYGTEEDRIAFLKRQLHRARRFRDLLDRDPQGFDAPAIHSIQNDAVATSDRAVLPAPQTPEIASGVWFTGDRLLRRSPELLEQISSPGDGHATVESQLALSPRELEALVGEPLYVPGTHFSVLLHPEALRRFVEALTTPPTATPTPRPAPSPRSRPPSAP